MRKHSALLPWITALSLAGNVFLGVVLYQRGPFHGHRPPPGPPDPQHIVEHMTQDLPPADADIIRAAFAARTADFEALRNHPHFAEQIRQALLAEPFDKQALRQAIEAGISDHLAFERVMEDTMVDALAAMSPQGRRKFAEHPIPGAGGPPGPPGGGPSGGPGEPPPPRN